MRHCCIAGGEARCVTLTRSREKKNKEKEEREKSDQLRTLRTQKQKEEVEVARDSGQNVVHKDQAPKDNATAFEGVCGQKGEKWAKGLVGLARD